MAKAAVDPVSDLLATASKKFNMSVGRMDEIADDVRFVSTGNLAIDYAIGGGYPLGRSIELSGPPSCGKTTTALQAVVETQRIIKGGGDPALGIGPDDRILYLDYEQAMDIRYAKALGLDYEHDSFLFTQPDTLEDGANFILAAVRTGMFRLIVVDSVAGMLPSAKAEAEIGKSLPAVQAKLMTDFGSAANVLLAKHNTSIIYLNHLKEKMAMGGGRPGMPPPTTTPGGIALKYFASVRVEYKQIRQNKSQVKDPLSGEMVEIPTSTDVKVKVVKNKVSSPFREALVRVRFGKGFDNFWTALQVLLSNKRVMHQGGMYYFHNVEEAGMAPEWMARATTGTKRPYIKGEAKLMAEADNHPEWRAALIEEAQKIAKENQDAFEFNPLEQDDEEAEELDELIGGKNEKNRVQL